MLKMKPRRKPRRKNQHLQKGQVLVIVVFAITALVAFVGLVIDTGLVFIQYGRLRRAVDSAALSASLQFREGFTIDDLEKAAVEFLVLNGIDDPSATVDTCDTEALLCDTNDDGDTTDPGEQRKFVHVVARSNVQLAFLPVIGITTVPLAAEAVSEAASVDVVLVIDRSESMSHEADPFPNASPAADRDPRRCNSADAAGNPPGDCAPFEEIKVAAKDFVNNLYFPYDRVAIVTFDRNVHCEGPSPCDSTFLSLALSNDESQILTRINNLTVFDPEPLVPADPVDSTNAYQGGCQYFWTVAGPCRLYEDDADEDDAVNPCVDDDLDGEVDDVDCDGNLHEFQRFECPPRIDTGDPSTCSTTNIGGGLLQAGNEFARGFREESLWVVILITDGAANSSTGTLTGGNDYCPSDTWNAAPVKTPCRYDGYVDSDWDGIPEADPDTRHCRATDNATCLAQGGVVDEVNYNADDYARDMADFVGIGQNALIFSIGLGVFIDDAPFGDPLDGQELLEYAAEEVGGGIYYPAPTSDELRDIFANIADKIAVRLTH